MRGCIVYIWIGVWLLILPFLGIPGRWKDALLISTALFVIVYAFVGYRNTMSSVSPMATDDSNDNTESAARSTADEHITPS